MAKRQHGERISRIYRVVVAVLLLTAIVTFVDAESVVATFKEANPLWIAAALALLPVNIAFEVWKWRLLLSETVGGVTVSQALASVLSGYALGFVTPARFGDYAGRVFSLADARKGTLVVLAALDRMYSMWIYALAGTVILGFQLEGSPPGPGGVWWLSFVLGVTLTLVTSVFVLRPSTVYTVSTSLLRWRSIRRWRRHFKSTRKISPSTSLSVLLLSITRYGVFCSQFVLIVLAFSPGSTVAALFAGVALVFFAKTIVPSISIFDLGIRESASVFFLGLFGVAHAVAFNASLLLFVVNLALPALVGIAFVPRLKWKNRVESQSDPSSVQVRTG